MEPWEQPRLASKNGPVSRPQSPRDGKQYTCKSGYCRGKDAGWENNLGREARLVLVVQRVGTQCVLFGIFLHVVKSSRLAHDCGHVRGLRYAEGPIHGLNEGLGEDADHDGCKRGQSYGKAHAYADWQASGFDRGAHQH